MPWPAAAEEEVQEEEEEEEGEEEDARETFPVVNPGPSPPRAGKSCCSGRWQGRGGSVLGLRAPNGALPPSLPVASVLQPPPAPLGQGVPDATLGALLKAAGEAAKKRNKTVKSLSTAAHAQSCLPAL